MRRLHISKKDSKIFGVCGGIAETYDLDPTLVRLAVVFLAMVTAIVPVTVTYFIAYFVMPDPEE